jgi:hypothetical protein
MAQGFAGGFRAGRARQPLPGKRLSREVSLVANPRLKVKTQHSFDTTLVCVGAGTTTYKICVATNRRLTALFKSKYLTVRANNGNPRPRWFVAARSRD